MVVTQAYKVVHCTVQNSTSEPQSKSTSSVVYIWGFLLYSTNSCVLYFGQKWLGRAHTYAHFFVWLVSGSGQTFKWYSLTRSGKFTGNPSGQMRFASLPLHRTHQHHCSCHHFVHRSKPSTSCDLNPLAESSVWRCRVQRFHVLSCSS